MTPDARVPKILPAANNPAPSAGATDDGEKGKTYMKTGSTIRSYVLALAATIALAVTVETPTQGAGKATGDSPVNQHAEQTSKSQKPGADRATQRQSAQPVAKAKARNQDIFAPIVDDPALPRALLIGDSISMGYTLAAREILKGKVNLHRIPRNGASTRDALEYLDSMLGDRKWDVIHFNWGLHDIKYLKDNQLDLNGTQNVPLAAYEKNLRQLVKRLKATGARLIWASTTPSPQGSAGRKTEDVPRYNAVARKIMEENGVAIDDLYGDALSKCEPLRQAPDNVHFTPEGSKILAQSVAASIEAALKASKPSW